MIQREQPVNGDVANALFLRVQVAFAHCEANGFKIDREYLTSQIDFIKSECVRLEEAVNNFTINGRTVGAVWSEIFGDKKSFTNRQQLGTVLFCNVRDVDERNFGFECPVFTSTGAPEVSEYTLERVPGIEELAKNYILCMSYQKMVKTNLDGILKRLDSNDFLHPTFSLFSTVSYRSASQNPNAQNMPKRNENLAAVVRRCFIPRAPKNRIVELDYSGAEVRVNASINSDPMLVGSVTRGVDFHKDIAAKAYLLDVKDVTKKLRQSVKGNYTFAAFYGSYWRSIAKALWDGIEYGGYELADGTPLKKHIMSKGITGLGNADAPEKGSYYYHIKETDEWLWGDYFKVYNAWKWSNWKKYTEQGYVDLPTGFRCGGFFSRNFVNNAPAQGASAHCLLWSFCELDRELRERGYDALICGQIHDSIILDVPDEELLRVLRLAKEIMTSRLRKHFKWIAVPMEVEADVSPMREEGGSWWNASAYEF